MASREFHKTFNHLRLQFRAETKKDFFNDIEGQLEEDEDIYEIVTAPYDKEKYVAVSFDRKRNDTIFSYHFFDLALVILDDLAGGSGIYKPANQLRALQWNSNRRKLMQVLMYLGRNNPQLNFRRALILPFPRPPIGHRLDPGIYKK